MHKSHNLKFEGLELGSAALEAASRPTTSPFSPLDAPGEQRATTLGRSRYISQDECSLRAPGEIIAFKRAGTAILLPQIAPIAIVGTGVNYRQPGLVNTSQSHRKGCVHDAYY